ncbi:hypothetical protein DVR12_18775 [Chitinophaga silvatica]|uniref:Signal transduction histidine kinase internal region domain-containing protein n=1 Tax=Chitinophaga silvatica TaxID=2282649 RepID=A0A3E1Y6R8_9BACT|nr:sensor histidine kinase [Chitinophaga silvatica]RFS20607.1 hypothetical protein DVR12_18775 [Chitinophaga silvatica]
MFRLKSSVVIIHITGWLICLSLPLLFISGQTNDSRAFSMLRSPNYLIFLLTYIAIFYFHSTVLFPSLFFKKQYLLYGLSVLLLLMLVNFLQPFDHLVSQLRPPRRPPGSEWLPPGPPMPGADHRPPARLDFVSDFLFLLTISLSIATETTHRWRQTEKRALFAETRKTQAELSFLKAQINPHFLFNTLNNIYSLAMTHSEHTATSIMKLSNMLRYVTEESKGDFVLLENEIDCLNDYLDLQKLRLTSKTIVSFSITGNPGIKNIAPLVLLPFLENAFKYGVSNHEASEINIVLDCQQSTICFFCTNKIFRSQQDKNSTGIGISNTRQRLDHLYGNRYTLDINSANGIHNVSLLLPS